MLLADKKIGIWGFGVVGKSLTDYLSSLNNNLSVFEKRELTPEEKSSLQSKNISFFDNNIGLENFLESRDIIIPSPGIDLTEYAKYNHKFITELDVFYTYFKKPIIAITGTVGKTTVTHFIAELLKSKKVRAIAAGNIGLGMCDLIKDREAIDCVVLEVSSFQLEHCKLFAPDLALWTNFYPNHLDRHVTLDSYFTAKSKIFINQKAGMQALLPFELYSRAGSCNFFCLDKPGLEALELLKKDQALFFIENNKIIKLSNQKYKHIFDYDKLPKITYPENWLMICATLYLFGIDLNNIENQELTLPEHRLEKFATVKSVDFYNDSKSTIPDATIAAVTKLQSRPIILFLGGLSKGVDRSLLVQKLKDKVKFIICFGKEAGQLKSFCDKNNIMSNVCPTLEDAILHCFEIMCKNDQVLFSPAGSSFDLFADYKQRGTKFKQLVNNMK